MGEEVWNGVGITVSGMPQEPLVFLYRCIRWVGLWGSVQDHLVSVAVANRASAAHFLWRAGSHTYLVHGLGRREEGSGAL